MDNGNRVLIIHDREQFREYDDFLQRREIDATLVNRPSQFWKLIGDGSIKEFNVVVIHKDFGSYIPEEEEKINIEFQKIIDLIHRAEPLIRIGIVSGEYPDGELEVRKAGADFYFSANIATTSPWVFEQLKRGYVTDVELSKRGYELEKVKVIEMFSGKESA
jgi:hypothetical protein